MYINCKNLIGSAHIAGHLVQRGAKPSCRQFLEFDNSITDFYRRHYLRLCDQILLSKQINMRANMLSQLKNIHPTGGGGQKHKVWTLRMGDRMSQGLNVTSVTSR
jgi:hypothetical protein